VSNHEFRRSLLQGGHPSIPLVLRGGEVELLEIGDALQIVSVTVDVANLKGGEALLDGGREGRDANGLQTGQLLL
jgi:hypothetical protein